MIDWATAQKLIADQIQTFPTEFGLRAFPGDRFRISPRASYVNDAGIVQLYTQRLNTTLITWQDFAKGSPEELRRELVELPKIKPGAIRQAVNKSVLGGGPSVHAMDTSGRWHRIIDCRERRGQVYGRDINTVKWFPIQQWEVRK